MIVKEDSRKICFDEGGMGREYGRKVCFDEGGMVRKDGTKVCFDKAGWKGGTVERYALKGT